MATPESFIGFAVANVVAWPGIALTYWYLFQREEESMMDELVSATSQESEVSSTKNPAESEV